jgi:dCMP deaminase
MAKLVASWSKDPSTKIGSVIMDPNGNPVSHGFNGFPRGMADTPERLNNREFKYRHILHSEDNAMAFANVKYFDGCTIYITHPPCVNCLSRMRQRRLFRVVCYDGGEEFATRWPTQDSVDLAKELGIELIIIKS